MQSPEFVNKKGFLLVCFAARIFYLAPDLVETMRKILSEKNVAAILFVLVILAFSFAHEDSKKRSSNYSVSANSSSPEKSSATLTVSNSPKADH